MRSIPLSILTLCYWLVIMIMQMVVDASGVDVSPNSQLGAKILMFIGAVLWTGTFILAIFGV